MSRRNVAFTLGELLVVISVIILLVAMLMPTFQQAFAIQRRVQCQGNLSRLGQAYYTHQARAHVASSTDAVISAPTWVNTLMAQSGDSQDVFTCPEDPKATRAGDSALEKLKQIKIEVYRGAPNTPAAFYWALPLDRSFVSSYVWWLGQEQWAVFEATPNHGKGYAYAGYQPGANANIFYLAFEDQGPGGGGDMDFWDQMVKIELTATKIIVTPISGQAGYNFTMVTYESGKREVLLPNMKAANLQPYVIPGGYGKSSYGMNSQCADLMKSERRLLVLDYETHVAAGSVYSAQPDAWLTNETQFPTKIVDDKKIPIFFRHFNKSNILMADGAVEIKSYDDISIFKASSRAEYWDPRNPRYRK